MQLAHLELSNANMEGIVVISRKKKQSDNDHSMKNCDQILIEWQNWYWKVNSSSSEWWHSRKWHEPQQEEWQDQQWWEEW